VNARELALLERHGPEALAREGERQAEQRRKAKLHRRTKRGLAAGLSRAERRAAEDQLEAIGKADAYGRAGRKFDEAGAEIAAARCEYVCKGRLCAEPGVAADHVIGGSGKSDMEAIGADGFQILCLVHNHLKTVNSPTRAFWLDVAQEHALRVGARKLLPFIARARAKLEGKRRA
jgi:hypothetical protein